MSTSVGVVSIYDLASLKQYALLFDQLFLSNPWRKVWFPSGPDTRDLSTFTGDGSINADVEWLRGKGVILNHEPTDKEVQYLAQKDPYYQKYAKAAIELILTTVTEEGSLSEEQRAQFGMHIARRDAVILQKAGINAIPVLREFSDLADAGAGIKKDNVVSCVVKQLPIPDDLTPWEDILHFKRDEHAHSALLRLKRWITKTATQVQSVHDVSEELEYLLDEYSKHLTLHNIKTRRGFLETLLVGGATLVENLVKLKLSKVAKGLFAFRQQQIVLMEEELKLPGREVAYIIRAKEVFRRDDV